MKKILSSLICSIIIAGCVQRPYVPQMSQAQSEVERKKNLLDSGQARFKACTENLRNTDSNKKLASSVALVDNEVLFREDNSPNKVALMSSNAKITETQKKALLELISASQECRNLVRQSLSSFPALLPSYENFYGEMDIVYANLISKKITIGQANQEKAKLLAKAKSEYASGISSMDNQFRQQHNQEMQARQAEDMQRRAIAAQYLMNQQQIQSQQNIANQQMLQNQINSNKPVTTNCNRYGNQVNCTSY